MNNLVDIQGQIQKLQKQADEIKSRDFQTTVQEILAKMQAFGISTKDLLPGKRRGPKGRAKAAVSAKKSATRTKKPSTPVAAKYKGPEGQTWSGRGLMPRWLSALVAGGQTKEDFLIKN